MEDLITAVCGGVCVAFGGGVAVGIMYMSFVYDDRASTKRIENMKPGTQPFRPDSRLKKWHRHPDMLENGSHPSRNNEDDGSQGR